MFEMRKYYENHGILQDEARKHVYKLLEKDKLSRLVDIGVTWHSSRRGNTYWQNTFSNFIRAEDELKWRGKEETYENIIQQYERIIQKERSRA
jgi:hypothetical protein